MASGIPTPDEFNAMSGAEFKVYENRLRRISERQGLKLLKSRRRDPRSSDYCTYMLVRADTNYVEASGVGGQYGLQIDEVARALGEE